MISSLLYDLNHAALWQRRIPVWDRSVRAASLDRLVYLALHRFGWMGEQESRLLRSLIKPRMQIVDVGANIGLYALLFARLIGPEGCVFAFEPEPNLSAAFTENCRANHASNIVPFALAAGNAPGRAAFRRATFNSGDNGFELNGAGSVQVEVVRVDDVLPVASVDFIKVDVQGHELAVFAGMEKLLAASQDVRVLFEFSPAGLHAAQTAPEALLSFFSERDFRIYETEEPRLAEVSDFRQLIRKLPCKRYTNLLASRTAVSLS